MTLDPRASALFSDLRASSAHPDVVAWLQRTTIEGTEFDGYKINAFGVAEQVGVSRLDATRALLFATRLGVTDLTWDLHCPMCHGVAEYRRHLTELPERAHCDYCSAGWDVSIEDQLEATFTLNPNVRTIEVAKFREQAYLRDRDPMFQRIRRDGRLPTTGMFFGEGAVQEFAVTLGKGEYDYRLRGDDRQPGRLVVAGVPTTEEQRVSLKATAEGHFDVRSLSLRPGPVRLEVHIEHPRDQWGMHLSPADAPGHWVSATYITSLQDFRDLFAGEFLAADRSFAIRNITLLFTDITGSTEMYERLGDAKAFALVYQHFELMAGVIRQLEGGIVKTIGDAVMAAFPINVNAAKAAIEIQKGFAEVSEPLNQIAVKIGLHRGPTIAVTSNRLLDYFGRTVNIAARVQSASRSGEVLATEAVLSDPAVSEWRAREGVQATARTIALKGITDAMPVISLAHAGSGRPGSPSR
jgi:adenylate cyclase